MGWATTPGTGPLSIDGTFTFTVDATYTIGNPGSGRPGAVYTAATTPTLRSITSGTTALWEIYQGGTRRFAVGWDSAAAEWFVLTDTTGERTIRVHNDGTLELVGGGGNVGLGTATQFGSGERVLGFKNSLTIPSANPTNAGVLYVQSGHLKYRGAAGTVTTVASA